MGRNQFAAVVVFILLLIVLVVSLYDPQKIFSTSSPDSRYTVRVTQSSGVAGIERRVYLNASSAKESLVENKLLFTGDLLDDNFKDLYPNHWWLSDSVLKIGQGDILTPQPDMIVISNNTIRRLNYLLVETYDDKFLILDVAPRAVINLRFHISGRLSCQGEFAESGGRFGDAAELVSKHSAEGGARFMIDVSDSGINIVSPQHPLNHVTCCVTDRPDFDHELSY